MRKGEREGGREGGCDQGDIDRKLHLPLIWLTIHRSLPPSLPSLPRFARWVERAVVQQVSAFLDHPLASTKKRKGGKEGGREGGREGGWGRQGRR